MGPIVGAGFALGIFDFVLLRKSLKNLLIATIAVSYTHLDVYKRQCYRYFRTCHR